MKALAITIGIFGLALIYYWKWIKWLYTHNSSILPWSNETKIQRLFDKAPEDDPEQDQP
jgi:hypothetical protein